MRTYKLFIDESGDHGLVNINQEFPVFVLCGLLIEVDDYEKIRKTMNEIKNSLWHGKKVIFHSRDIRKCEKEFVILFDENKKKDFYEKISQIFSLKEFIIIASVINKNEYILRHGKLGNDVYEISLSFVIEKCVNIIMDNSNKPFELKIYIEKRGRKEDQKLSEHFQKIKSRGTGSIKAEIFTKYIVDIEFKDKKEDINGLQLTDLAAYPIARYVIDKERANPAFDILKDKIYNWGDELCSLMLFP